MWFSKLLPREGNFFELFNQHAAFTTEGARAFMAMIRNYNDIPLREKHASEVDVAERAADKITAEVHRLLHRTFITPIDGEQIRSLINSMDDIIDLLQDTSEVLSSSACCPSSSSPMCPRPRSRPARRSTASSPTPTA